jgi:hypothetical protein
VKSLVVLSVPYKWPVASINAASSTEVIDMVSSQVRKRRYRGNQLHGASKKTAQRARDTSVGSTFICVGLVVGDRLREAVESAPLARSRSDLRVPLPAGASTEETLATRTGTRRVRFPRPCTSLGAAEVAGGAEMDGSASAEGATAALAEERGPPIRGKRILSIEEGGLPAAVADGDAVCPTEMEEAGGSLTFGDTTIGGNVPGLDGEVTCFAISSDESITFDFALGFSTAAPLPLAP